MKNNLTIYQHKISFREFSAEQTDKLLEFLQNLSPESKNRFGPHPFTEEGIHNLFYNSFEYKLYIAMDLNNNSIIAYTIIKLGWLNFEYPRLSSYNLTPTSHDCTIAPSVADKWQSKGLGSKFLQYLINELGTKYSVKRLFLWGGVQASNNKAVAFYKKNGFKVLGEFEYNGSNFDMMLEVN